MSRCPKKTSKPGGKSYFTNWNFYKYRRYLHTHRRYLYIFSLKIKKHRRYVKISCLSLEVSIGRNGSFTRLEIPFPPGAFARRAWHSARDTPVVRADDRNDSVGIQTRMDCFLGDYR